MEIEFNPNRALNPTYVEAPKRQASAGAQNRQAESAIDTLAQKLEDTPAVRPEKVEQGREQLKDDKYPPDYLLDRIAQLLAIQIKK